MNKLLKIKLLLLSVLFFTNVCAQEEEAPELLLNLSYNADPSGIQFLKINTRTKENNKLVNVPGVKVTVYMDSISDINVVGELVTSSNGEGKLYIPAKFREQWKRSSVHVFHAISSPVAKMAEATTEINITQGKIEIDTLFEDDVRNVKLRVLKLDGSEWLPASDVEVSIGIKRYGGELPIGEEENYTTDSLGEIVAEFKRDSIPADSARDIELVARITDSDVFGNIHETKTVPWGVELQKEQKVQNRSLWATRDRAPIWLLVMAYFIIAVVWGTLVYLVILLVRIVRHGKERHDSVAEHAGEPESVLI